MSCDIGFPSGPLGFSAREGQSGVEKKDRAHLSRIMISQKTCLCGIVSLSLIFLIMRKGLLFCALGAAVMAPGANAAGLGEKNDASKGTPAPATFEDLGLAPDSYWRGDTDDEDYDYGSFRSGDFEFPNFYMADYDTWAWYAYSSIKANDGTTFMDQFQSAPGGGHSSDTFGVAYVDAYMGPSQVFIYGSEDGDVLKGMWVTNGAWTRYCVLNGDGLSGPFGTGDYLKVIVTGYSVDDEQTGTAEFYLADYRSENEAEHYALDTWEWMDLSGLGKIQYFEISMETTKANAYGPTTPMYTCIDDINTSEDFTAGIRSAQHLSSFGVTASAGSLSISNPERSAVSVYTLDGRKVYSTTDVDASVTVASGLYIVTDGNRSVKTVVR